MASATTSDGTVFVIVGTTKGAFVLRDWGGRQRFESSGPLITGCSVPAVAFDTRQGRRRLLAGASSFFFGTAVLRSDDLGQTWSEPTEGGNIAFPEGTDAALKQVWQIRPAGEA